MSSPQLKKSFLLRTGHFFRALFLTIFSMGISAVLAGVLVGGVALYILYRQVTPDISFLRAENIAQTSRIYDRTGQHVLYELYGEENRTIVGRDGISDALRKATVAAEDERFYSHSGVDPIAILRSIKANFENGSTAEGGSTITMQLARNVFFSREKTYERKISEALTAWKLEHAMGKEDILQWYLNIVPYGSNAYGAEAAAQTYFGKHASDLSLDEAALLASIPKATTYYSPYGTHTKDLQNRQHAILKKMKELGMVSDAEVRVALAEDTMKKVLPFRHAIDAPHFVMAVVDELKKKLGEEKLNRGGFSIVTTLDWDKQQEAERAVREGVERNKQYNASNAALVAMDPRTGETLAMAGSRGYWDTGIDGQVNVALRPRQPGSSFKPIAYAAAFEAGFQPETTVYDVPTNFGPDGSGADYTPQNYSGNFRGPVTLRQALAGSLNIPAVKVLYLAGVSNVIDLAHKLGITTLNEKNRYGLALVLGGGEITLYDGTAAFSVFANDGKRVPAHTIREVKDAKNTPVLNGSSEASTQVVSEETARKIDSVLSDNQARSAVFGTNSPLFIPGHTVAAKTGTTQEFHDAWTIGFTPSIVVGVWTGNNDNTAMRPGSDGVYVAAPIWNDFMQSALRELPDEAFPDYQRVESPIPMVTSPVMGKVVYYRITSGKKVSEEKAKKLGPDKVRQKIEGGGHDILYYLNSSEYGDANPFPKYSEDMAARWDAGVSGTDWTLANNAPDAAPND